MQAPVPKQPLGIFDKVGSFIKDLIYPPDQNNRQVFGVGEGLPQGPTIARSEAIKTVNKDLVRPPEETASQAIISGVAGIPKFASRAIARGALTAKAQLDLKAGRPITGYYTPAVGSFERMVLGNEPLEPFTINAPDSISSRYLPKGEATRQAKIAEAVKPITVEGQGEQFAKDIGLGKFGQRAIGTGAVLLSASDIEPGADLIKGAVKGVGKNIAKKLVKEGAEDVAENIVKGEAKNIVESKLVSRIKEMEDIVPDIKQMISSEHEVLKNTETIKAAQKMIADDEGAVIRTVLDPSIPATPEHNTAAYLLLQKAQKDGRFDDAVDIVSAAAKKATTQGQAIQALAMWGRLTPEGALKYAQRVVDDFNKTKLPKETLFRVPTKNKDVAQKAVEQLKLSGENAKKVTELAENMRNFKEGTREHAVAVGKLLDYIGGLTPPSVGEKIAAVQRMAQLLNPKTTIRNVIGNAGLFAIENLADVGAAVLDKPLSLITGTKSKALPSLSAQARGFKTGLKYGIEDALLGIKTSGELGKYEINKRIFRSGVLGGLDKAMTLTLGAPDRAFFEATRNGVIEELMKLKGVTKPDDQMLEIAHYAALRRTFQDDNFISKSLSAIKRGLNIAGIDGFGVGNLIINYPKTPGAIIKRGIEFSPLGFFEAMFELAKPLVGGGVKNFNQRAFVEKTSRALLGSGATLGLGAGLYRLGILSGKQPTDKDISAVQRESGINNYQINVSALKRYVMSGFDSNQAKKQKGDILANYDWLLPASIPIAMGANIEQNKGKDEGLVGKLLSAATGSSTPSVDDVANLLASSLEVVSEQPIIQGIRKVAQSRDLKGAIGQVASEVPASFVPTLLSQLKQLADNTGRNTYDPSIIEQALNKVMNKVPGLSTRLPESVTPFGKNREVYQGGRNNIFNVFFNPAFVNEYKPTPEAQLVLDIYSQSGETKQAPQVVDKKQRIFGYNIELSGKEQTEMQKKIGTAADDVFKKLANNQAFLRLPDKNKADILSNILSTINQSAKAPLLLNKLGVNVPDGMSGNMQYKLLQSAFKNPEFKKLSKEKQSELLNKIFKNMVTKR